VARLMLLGYRLDGDPESGSVPLSVADVSSSLHRLGTVADVRWFGWSGSGDLTLRSTDEARDASPGPGLVEVLLAIARPDAGLRPGGHEGSDDETERRARRVLEAIGPDRAALVSFVEDAREGVLAVVVGEPSEGQTDGQDTDDRQQLHISVDEPSLAAGIGGAARDQAWAPGVAYTRAPRASSAPAAGRSRTLLNPRGVWRAGLVVLALVMILLAGAFVLEDAGSLVFQLVMALFASIAMEPAVSRLSRYLRRGLATGVVMATVVVATLGFFSAFGNLLAEQVSSLALALPEALRSLSQWANENLGLTLDPTALASSLNVSPAQVASIGAEVAGGMLQFVANLLGGVFSMFTIGLFIFYFSADAPRLKRWVARLLPPRNQKVFVVAWDLAVQKTGGYVAARIVLAGVCGAITSLFLLVIGMDDWLALGLWTGVVSQFVPTIGTYIAIALPVAVGLTSSQPVDGVLALVFALVYQQIENLTIEPRISADAVDMHPAVSFASVLLGAALFGVGGALVAVPVAALGLALFQVYSRTFDLLPELTAPPD
jgi:predicted PurR-regulated permease PerM